MRIGRPTWRKGALLAAAALGLTAGLAVVWPHGRALLLRWVFGSGGVSGRDVDLEAMRAEAAQYVRANQPEQAEPVYRRMLEFDPAHLEALVGLERICYDSKRHEEAAALFRRAARVVPRGWEDHLLLGYWRLSFWDYARAAEHFQRVLESRPDHVMARRLLASSLIDQGKAEEAKEVLQPLLGHGRRDAVAHYLLARAYYEQQDLAKVREHLTAVLAYGHPRMDEYLDALSRLTELELDAGNYERAREWFEEVRRLGVEGNWVHRMSGLLESGSEGAAPPGAAPRVKGPEVASDGPLRFRAGGSEVGIDFRHSSPFSASRYLPETFGAGVAVLDFDGDGRMDLYFVNGGTVTADGPQPGPPSRLYRNLGGGTFAEVTEQSGAGYRGFAHGAIVADYDNDGDPDLFVASYGCNALLQNQGDGAFRDVTRQAGLTDERLSCGGAFFDADQDGDLDLYVSNYCKFDPRTMPECTSGEGKIIFCTPHVFEPEQHVFYRNNGDGTFSEATEQAGVSRRGKEGGRGFGVIAADFNLDGHIDLYVANDETPNFLFLGRGDGTFEDATETNGADRNLAGSTEGSMGVDAGDLNGDGLPDLFVTNYWNQTNTLYLNAAPGLFRDITARTVGKGSSRDKVGWGTAFADFDSDGWLDLIVTNGHVNDNVTGEPFAQPAQLWRGQGPERFVEESPVDAYFQGRHVGRGLAVGDLDDDGDLDVVISHLNGPATVLFNETPQAGAWIRLELRGVLSNRDAIGARVVVEAAGRTFHRQRTNGGSYLSAHDPRMLIGLGSAPKVDRLTVHWPSGQNTVLRDLDVQRTYVIAEESAGMPPADPKSP